MSAASSGTMPSQQVQAKAATYLLGGHVKVDYADPRSFVGLVRGTRETPYAVMWHTGEWRCDCPATRVCAHVLACQTIWQAVGAATTARQSWNVEDPFDLIPEA